MALVWPLTLLTGNPKEFCAKHEGTVQTMNFTRQGWPCDLFLFPNLLSRETYFAKLQKMYHLDRLDKLEQPTKNWRCWDYVRLGRRSDACTKGSAEFNWNRSSDPYIPTKRFEHIIKHSWPIHITTIKHNSVSAISTGSPVEERCLHASTSSFVICIRLIRISIMEKMDLAKGK